MELMKVIEKCEERLKEADMAYGDCYVTSVLEELLLDLKNTEEYRKECGFILDSSQVEVPQYIADWIEYCKNTSLSLVRSLMLGNVDFGNYANQKDHSKLIEFFRSGINQETFAKAWLFGYEVEKEKHYKIKIAKTCQYLYKNGKDLFFSSYSRPEYNPRLVFTKKELEQENFGWVFDCPGIEVEEVE